MPEMTIAQLVASISADTSAFDTRITKVEERLKKTQESAEKAAEGISSSFTRSAKGVDLVAEAAKNAQKAADNLAKYEYTTGAKSASDYASFLKNRLESTNRYSSEAKSIYSQLASVEVKIARDTDAIKRQLDSAYTASRKVEEQQIQNAEKVQLQVIQGLLADEERARQQVIDKLAEEATSREKAAKQAEMSAANVAKFEYATNAKSADDYALFLERRMAGYELYSSEWKAASAELVSVQRAMAAEAQAVEAEKDAAILARQKEIASERIAVEKEVQAAMVEANKAGLAAQTKAIEEAQAVQAEARKGQMATLAGGVKVGGSIAGGIAAVELGSAIVSSQFNHNITGEGNNTLMSTADIAKMRADVLQLGKETGQNMEDITRGARYVSDFAKSTDTAADKMQILTWANKEAVGTISNTEDVARSLSSVLSIFGLNSSKAAGTMDVLHHSAAAGALTVQQFATASGPALAIAAAMHDKFYDAAAAMSSLTKAGFDANEAATQIKSLYSHIGDPANEATKYIHQLDEAFHKLPGNKNSNINLAFDFSQPGIQLKGIVGLLKDIETVTGGRADIIAKAIPALRGGIGGTALAQALGVNGNDVDKLREKLKSLYDTNTGSETETIYQRMMGDSEQKWKKFAVTLETDFIPIGERAMAVFEKWEPAISKTVGLIVSLMEGFQKLPVPIQETVTAIGGLFILEKLTGVLVALQVPTALGAGLRTAFVGLQNVAKGAAFLEATPLASTLALWSTRLGGVALAGEGLATVLLGPVGIAIAAVVLAIAGLTIAWKTDFLHIQEVTANAWYEIKRGGVETGFVISDVSKSIGNYFRDEFSGIIKGASSTWSDMIKGATEFGPDIIKGLGLDGVVSAFDRTWTTVQTGFDVFTQTLGLKLNGLGSKLSSWWENTPAGKYLGSLSNRADNVVGSAPNEPGTTYKGPFDVFGSHGTSASGVPNNLESPGILGAKAALAADVEQTNAQAHDCQHRARIAIQSASHAFDAYFAATDPITKKVTANSVSGAMNAAGLLQPYTPGMSIKPGDLLYSNTLGAKQNTGHVSEIDSKGNRRDQYGSNHFPEKDYQYLFDPDYASAKLNNGQDTSVTPEMLAAQAAQDAANKKAAKEAESAAKALKQRYDTETRSLKEIITLKSQSSDLDNKHEHETKTKFDVSSSGDLNGIGSKQADILIALSKAADVAEQQRKVAELIRAMTDKVLLAAQSPLKQEAIGTMGGLRNWQSMTPGQQTGELSAQLTTDREDEANKNAKRLRDLAFAQSISGDAVKRAAVEAAGGADKWKLLSDATKIARLESERNLQVTDAVTKMQADYNAKVDENTELVKTNVEAANIAIAQKAKELGVKPTDPRFNGVRASASKADYNQVSAYFTNLDNKETENQAIFNANNKKAVDYSPQGEATAKFDADNREEIERIDKLTGSYKELALAKLNASRQKYVTDVTGQYVTTTSRELEAETKKLRNSATNTLVGPAQIGMSTGDKAVQDWIVNNQKVIKALGEQSKAVQDYEAALRANGNAEDFAKGENQMVSLLDGLGKQAVILQNSNPFDTWLKGFYTLQQVTGADGKKTLTYMLPSGMDVTNMKQIYDLQVKMAQQAKVASMLQGVASGATDAIMAGVNAGFNPDPSKTGSLQTQLLQQKQEYEQYQVAEAQFKNQYPNDPNDPYVTRLQDLQKAINSTNNQLHSMGSNIGATFKRMFDTMAQSFEQTLTKMAQSYLQSQLLAYISKQVGTGAGAFSGGGSGGILGSVISGIGGILGNVAGGSGGVDNSTFNNTAPISNTNIPKFGDGGSYTAGQPFWAGERGQKELIIPSTNGNVIPSSKIRQTGGSSSNVVNNNTNVHMTVNTPDVQSFRSSRATIVQQVGRSMGARKR